MRYTTNINLPIVEDNDLYSKEINNLAFERIDEEIKGLAEIVETLESPENSIADIKEQLNDISYYITPELFGYQVECDVSINDSLQKCFDYCRDNNGGTIIVKRGSHKSNGTMHIYKNTRLILEEGAEIVCQGLSPTPLVNGNPQDIFTGYNGNGNIYIEGGIWTSNSIDQPESNRNLFGFAHCDGLTIKNVTFKNVKECHCIDLNSSRNVLIENCNFLGFKDSSDGDRTFAEAIQIAEHTPLGFTGVGTADRTPCKDVIIKSCYFGKSDYYGAYGSGIGNHSSVNDVFQDNIKIDSCTFDGMLFAGVRPFKWTNVSITNCTFKKCSNGILISAVKGGSLSAEDCEGIQSNKCQSGRDYFIQGNLFEDCEKQAINISGQISSENLAFIESIIISQNVIKYSDLEINKNSAIYIQKASNYKILNNIFENTSRGIWLKYTNNGVISSNTITKAKYEGIFINENSASTDEDDANILNGNYYSNTLVIDNNTVIDVGRTAFNIGYTKKIKLSNNLIKNACYETNGTRSAILIASNTQDGEIFNNVVEKIELQKNKYGIEVTGSCLNIECYNNDCYGKEKNISLSQVAIKEKNSLNSIKWIDCKLNSGITSYSSSQSPQFTKNGDGLVTIRGAVTHDKAFRGILFTLPDGYKPNKLTFFITTASNGNSNTEFTNDVKINRIFVNLNGEVKLESSNSVSDVPFTSLDINFYVN